MRAAKKEEAPKAAPVNDGELKELRAKLKSSEEKLVGATSELSKMGKELEGARKSAEEAKKYGLVDEILAKPPVELDEESEE